MHHYRLCSDGAHMPEQLTHMYEGKKFCFVSGWQVSKGCLSRSWLAKGSAPIRSNSFAQLRISSTMLPLPS